MDNISLVYHTTKVAKAIEILKRRWVSHPLPSTSSIPTPDVYEDLWNRAGIANPLDVNWMDVVTNQTINKEYMERVLDILEDQLTLCKYDTAITLHPVHTAFCVFVECFGDLYQKLIETHMLTTGSDNLSAIN